MRIEPQIAGISHSVGKEMAASSHTPCCYLNKPRSSLEAGKKQPRIWLQYVCGVAEVLLSSSFGVPVVLLLSLYGDSEMARNGFKDGSKWCTLRATHFPVPMKWASHVHEPIFKG